MTTAERLRKQGIKQGEQIGEVKGKKLARIEYARRMVEKGYPAADICDITGLSLEELKTLQLQK